jgi:hypothetical protein
MAVLSIGLHPAPCNQTWNVVYPGPASAPCAERLKSEGIVAYMNWLDRLGAGEDAPPERPLSTLCWRECPKP